MDTQLSRFIQPCRSSLVPFDGTISSERVAHTGVQPTLLRCAPQRGSRLPLGGGLSNDLFVSNTDSYPVFRLPQ